jgi:hypothetical protein
MRKSPEPVSRIAISAVPKLKPRIPGWAEDADHVLASSILLIVAPGGTPGVPGTVLGLAAITHRVVRTALGWRIARRTVGGLGA